jgi:hypothetical protein
MSYRIKQEKISCEDLEIELTDGTVKTYHPVLSADNAVKEYRDLLNHVSKIDFNNVQEDMYEHIGAVVVQLLSMLFDEEQALDMIKTFKDKYIELLSALFPYLEDVVKPYIEKIDKERKEHYRKLNETL